MVMLQEYVEEALEAAREAYGRAMSTAIQAVRAGTSTVVGEKEAQGTTEYAILVGVLVVIAIVAIVAFRGKVSELWDSISSGINSL